MDRARTDDDKQPIILAANDGARLLASAQHGFYLGAGGRQLFLDLRRSDEPDHPANAEVFQRKRGCRSVVRFSCWFVIEK